MGGKFACNGRFRFPIGLKYRTGRYVIVNQGKRQMIFRGAQMRALSVRVPTPRLGLFEGSVDVASVSRSATANQMNQLESGPADQGKECVRPMSAARLQKAKT